MTVGEEMTWENMAVSSPSRITSILAIWSRESGKIASTWMRSPGEIDGICRYPFFFLLFAVYNPQS